MEDLATQTNQFIDKLDELYRSKLEGVAEPIYGDEDERGERAEEDEGTKEEGDEEREEQAEEEIEEKSDE